MRRATPGAHDVAGLVEALCDFETFTGLCDIRTKSRGIRPFRRTIWNGEQARFQRERTGRDIVLKPRQIGFTTLELARDVHHAITRPGENVLVVVHDVEIKKKLFEGVRLMADGLREIGLLPRTRYDTVDAITFADLGSSLSVIEAGATANAGDKKGRSGTVHRLHCTEMAFWGAALNTWTALENTVPASGEIVIESTANGAGGLFYAMVQAAREGTSPFRLHFFPWLAHEEYKTIPPRGFDPAPRDKWEERLRDQGATDMQIAWWRSKVAAVTDLERVLQEFPPTIDAAFRVFGRAFFDPELMDDLGSRTRQPLRVVKLRRTDKTTHQVKHLGELWIYEEPRGERYIAGGDVSEGTGADASALVVIERRSGRTVAVLHTDTLEPGDFGLAMVEAGKLYNTAQLAPERNNHGHAALRAILTEAAYPNVFRTDDGKPGWVTDKVTRPIMIDDLAEVIRDRKITTPDARVAAECKTLVRDDSGKVLARAKGEKDGCRDDLWMAWAIAWAARARPEFRYDPIKIPGM